MKVKKSCFYFFFNFFLPKTPCYGMYIIELEKKKTNDQDPYLALEKEN